MNLESLTFRQLVTALEEAIDNVMVKGRFRLVLVAALFCELCAGIRCTVEVTPDFLQDSDAVQARTGDPPADDVVRIRFRNFTADEAVDVEFHATNNKLTNLPTDLFVSDHHVTASVGVAGTGIIEPRHEDVIEFPCTPNLTIGTSGGRFVDHETGEARGVGVPRWAQEGPLELCGAVVTFEFAGDGTGFSTFITIGH